MPSWFSKVFKNGEGKAKPIAPSPVRDALVGGIDVSEDEEPAPQPGLIKPRRVVNAPVLTENTEQSGWSADIRIKARVEKGNGACVFMVDRPVFEGRSAWFPSAALAAESPLAQALFAVDGVDSVIIHDFTVTVGRKPTVFGDWDQMAKDIGSMIRTHLLDEKPVVSDAFLAGLPSEDAIRETLQRVIDTEINPGIAAHSGAIKLDRVEGNTVYIEMMGGCQGCAASDITLRQGIHEAFRNAMPGVGAILDVTDHSAGKNPFYNELPAGMS
jgi:Fe-S cluster biogenesis protein NfuA